MRSALRLLPLAALVVVLGCQSQVRQSIRELEDPDRETRRAAAHALGRMGPTAGDAVPALTKALTDEDYGLRWNATIALGKIGKRAAPAVPALVARLEDEVLAVRQSSLYALRKLGEAGVMDAIDALERQLRSRDSSFRLIAAASLGRIGAPARRARPTLVRLAREDPDESVREAAAIAARRVGPRMVPGLTNRVTRGGP